MKIFKFLICFLLSSGLSMASDNGGGELAQPIRSADAVSFSSQRNQEVVQKMWESYLQQEQYIERKKCQDTCLVVCVMATCAALGIYSGMPTHNSVGLYANNERYTKKMN